MAKKEEPKIQANNELEKKIIEAFEVFDHSGKQVVDVREIGTILRSLGCCPTEAEIQEVILATENKEATGNVPLINFLPFMCTAMTEHRFYPASAEMLLAAFRYFDKEARGFLTKERFAQLMLEEGEPFTQEEFDEMMQTALDPVTDTITYEYYINQLMPQRSNGLICMDIVEDLERGIFIILENEKDPARIKKLYEMFNVQISRQALRETNSHANRVFKTN